MSMTSVGMNARRAVVMVRDADDWLRRVGSLDIWRGILARAQRCGYGVLTCIRARNRLREIYVRQIEQQVKRNSRGFHEARVNAATLMFRDVWQHRECASFPRRMPHPSLVRKRLRWRRRWRREARAWVMVLRALRARGPLNKKTGKGHGK